MKSAISILCVALAIMLVASPIAFGAVDDVETLFGGAAPATTDDVLSPFSDFPEDAIGESGGDAAGESSSHSAPDHWAASEDPNHTLHGAKADPSDQRAAREPAPGASINAVPEPSAVILALAALVYFLLFGRRRVA